MKIERPKVTLISPVYNGEKYIERFLESVLSQSFTDIQIIIVDDGSNDNTYDILQQYSEKMNRKFRDYIVVREENNGAAYAVNNALKYVEGEYLSWADSDDELMSNNIQKKVDFLEKNPSYGMVVCQAQVVYQDNGELGKVLSIPINNRSDNMFLQIIKGIPVYPGVFMIRSSALFEHINDREIYYNPNAGQNYQLLLPVAYYEKCGFIDTVLYKYYIRNDSHSRNVDYKDLLKRTYVHEELLRNVCSFIPEEEKGLLMKDIHSECVNRRFQLSFQHQDKIGNNNYYMELKELNEVSFKECLKNYIVNLDILYKFYKMVKR